MIPVLTKEQAYKLDKDTIESGHLSKEELMDNAGRAVAQFFCEKIKNPFSKKVVVVCGKGNNGGDGVITHSYLKKYNVSSKIVFAEQNHGHSKLLKKYKISKSEYSTYNDKIKFDNYDWIIDGIFGIGFSGELNNKYSDLFKKINYNKNIISIDMPSGYLDVYNDNLTIDSEYTVTFGYSKLSHFMNPVNNISVIDIGFKDVNSKFYKLQLSDIKSIIKKFSNKKNVHKYNSRVNISAGSNQYPGAALLCCKAAIKTGSGYVALYNDDSNNKELFSKLYLDLPEVIVNKPLGDFDIGETPFLVGPGNNNRSIFDLYLGKSMEFVEHYDPTLFDPGWDSTGNPKHAKVEEDRYRLHARPHFVLDAMSLNKGDLEHMPDCIMTPHIGELQRMLGIEDNFILNLDVFKDIQSKIANPQILWGGENKVVILKSFNIFIITKDEIYIMDKGPSLLATAGTGDVLSGILVSLLSQGYSRLEASILGTYLHAEAANYYMNNISKDGMTASDLIDCIPYAFNKLRKND